MKNATHASALKRAFSLLFGIAIVVGASPAQAATNTWTGAFNIAYTNAANWNGGVPSNGDWGDTARFTENTPGNKTPTLYATRTVQVVLFSNSTGWTLDGGSGRTLVLRQILSTGNGTNSLTVMVKNAYANTWSVGAGNTVILAGGFYADADYTTILNGGGMLQINSAIQGWSTARRFRVSDGVLRVAAASPMATHGAVIIGTKKGRLQIKNTVAGAKALIGTRILDGVGSGLAVADIGGGYVELYYPYTLITLR